MASKTAPVRSWQGSVFSILLRVTSFIQLGSLLLFTLLLELEIMRVSISLPNQEYISL